MNILGFTKDEYMKEVEAGYISRRVHPQDENIVILNYTDLCVYEKKWNKITLACRGLIVNEKTNRILALPFGKFFNYNENNGLELVIPHEKPVITIKQDGSLGISYRLNGKLCWATRGSFESEQAKEAQRVWDEKYSHIDISEDITLMAEIVTPKTRVVVDYNGLDDLIIIGARNITTGKEITYDRLENSCNLNGLSLTKRVDGNLDQMINKIKTLTHNEEGFVLHWEDSELRLKVKGEKYLEIHRLMYGLSDKQKFLSWANGSFNERIIGVPEEFRNEFEAFRDKLEDIKDVLMWNLIDTYDVAPKQTKKDFALWVNENVINEHKHFMFLLFDNRDEDFEDAIKKWIANNYIELMKHLDL